MNASRSPQDDLADSSVATIALDAAPTNCRELRLFQSGDQTATYTASELASALSVKRQTIAAILKNVPPDGTKRVAGNDANAWCLPSLPASLLARLEQTARLAGYRDAASMLAAPRLEWQPPLPLAQCSDDCIAKTRQLREALSQAIELRNNSLIAPARLVEMGLADYQRVFGHSITERHWRDLFQRTLHRAGRAGNFDRLELYLPERPQRRPAPVKERAGDFAHLSRLIDSFAQPANPSAADESALWDAAFVLLSESADATATKRALLAFLHASAPFLAANANALRVAFDRKYGKWLLGNQTLAALDDGRARREQDKPELSEREHLRLLDLCTRFENVSLGWHKFIESPDASDAIKSRYQNFTAGRPRVPEWVRDTVTRDAQNLGPYIRGPRTAKLAGAYIERDPNALAAGDSDQCDDLTLPLIWFERNPDGLFLGQGQLLVWIDERSWLIYGFDLISDGAYSGFSIRNSWTKKAETHGLPRKKIHVEMGIWRNAKVFVGSRNEVGTNQTELGLRRLGIRFHHSTLPRGKVIERLFGSQQDLLQIDRGYVGRNQMLDKYERVQKQLKLVKAGHAEPEEFFYEKREVLKRLEQVACELNTTPKHGKYHDGFSPLEVYQRTFTSPLMKTPPQFRHLVADNIVETTVGRNGVAFTYGGRTYRYKNSAELGRYKGQRVCAWFSPGNPDYCSITDMNGNNPIVVPLEPLVPTDGATPDQMTRAYESNANFERYYKDLHRAIRTTFPPEFELRRFRHVIADDKAVEFARDTQEQKAAMETERREQQSIKGRTHRKARELGIAPAALVDDPARANRGMELIEQARRKHQQREQDENKGDDGGGVVVKTYVLKPSATAPDVANLRKRVWAMWKTVEQWKPDLNRHAITQKTLGHNHSVNDFSAEECARMIEVCSAIVRDAKKKGAE